MIVQPEPSQPSFFFSITFVTKKGESEIFWVRIVMIAFLSSLRAQKP
jgi:hypothetical protein